MNPFSYKRFVFTKRNTPFCRDLSQVRRLTSVIWFFSNKQLLTINWLLDLSLNKLHFNITLNEKALGMQSIFQITLTCNWIMIVCFAMVMDALRIPVEQVLILGIIFREIQWSYFNVIHIKVAPRWSGYHYCITSFNQVFTQVLRRFRFWSRNVEGLQ